MGLLDVLIDLLIALPFWLLVAWIVFSFKLRRRDSKHWSIYAVAFFLLFAINLLLAPVHYRAIFGSGPFHGVVIDQISGQPIAGVKVTASWSKSGRTPVAIPLWARALESMFRLPCRETAVTMLTDSAGGFKSNSWYGAKVWQGCQPYPYQTIGNGYKYMHEDEHGRNIFYPTSESVRIELTPESPEGQGKGY